MTKAQTATAEVNGARIYREVRGTGPSVLINTKDALDAEHYREIAELLSDEFTVVTYDRRLYSRSTPPAGTVTTTVQEQADDAAALVKQLGVAPVVSYGSSGGAQITLDLVLRHPRLLRGAIVHEPPEFSVLPQTEEIGAGMLADAQKNAAQYGARATMEGFAPQMFGEEAWRRYPEAQRERILANADRFFGIGMPGFRTHTLDGAALASSGVPLVPMIGRDNRDSFFGVIARWIAKQVGAEVVEIPGLHAGDITDPVEFVGILRPLLRKMT